MFELLAIHWNVDPVIFNIGPLSIRWYSILFVSGFVIGWFIFRWFFRREGISENLLDSLLYTLLIGTIVGARLGHCIFYQPEYYFGSWEGFLEVFMPWKGGLASHGGAIALIIAMIWYAKHYGGKNGFDFVWLMDHLAITVAFAGALIRLGNLFNSEIYGVETDLPWGVVFERNANPANPADPEWLPHHPAQIYESLSYLILGTILILLYKFRLDKTYRGTYIGLFLIGCFGMRFLIEFIKNGKDTMLFGMQMKMGQALSIPFILLGIGFLVYAYVRRQPASAYVERSRKPGSKPLKG